MPRIVIGRKSDAAWLGKGVDILVDGRERARIGRNGRADVAVEAGVHQLQARIGRDMSQPINFRIAAGETIGFDCIVAGAWRKGVTLAQAYRQMSDERFKSQAPPNDDVPPKAPGSTT